MRPVTVPISIFTKQELEKSRTEEFIQAERLVVKEDKEDQTILSIRSISDSPLQIEVLIDDALSGNINLQLADIAAFIRKLPKGTRVFVANIRGGSLDVRQKFTDDLPKAAKSLRISTATPSSNGPYSAVADATGRFDGLPAGRRAILLVSDGLDASQGLGGFAAARTLELDRAIDRAQRKGIAVYSFYSTSALTASSNSQAVMSGQAALDHLSDQTGGRAFMLGTSAPVSFEPFIRSLDLLLSRQFVITYLSTHMKKGYHTVSITSTNPAVKIEHPKGYFYR